MSYKDDTYHSSTRTSDSKKRRVARDESCSEAATKAFAEGNWAVAQRHLSRLCAKSGGFGGKSQSDFLNDFGQSYSRLKFHFF